MTEFSNHDDVIDSRDVLERIEKLEGMLPQTAADVMPGTSDEIEDIKAELAILKALEADAEGYAPDWKYGCTLVRDSHFKDYAEELAEDCGMIQAGATWPNNCIDWDEAARQLKQDYTQVEFDGITYWVR